MKLFGVLATASSTLLTFGGLPMQLWTNYERKTCEGLNIFLTLAVLIAYSMWSLYGFSKKDIFLKISQPPGMVLSVLLLAQYIYYDFAKTTIVIRFSGIVTVIFLSAMIIIYIYQSRTQTKAD